MLETTKQVMTWLCMYPADDSLSPYQKTLYGASGLLVFLINSTYAAAHLAYIWKHFLTDLEGSLLALMILTAFGSVAYISIIAFSKRHKIAEIFLNLRSIYDACKCFLFYIELAIKCAIKNNISM